MEDTPLFVGRLNPRKRHSVILFILLLGIIIIPLAGIFDQSLAIIATALLAWAIIFKLPPTISSDENLLQFRIVQILHVKPDSATAYPYSECTSLEFFEPMGNTIFTRLTIGKKKFDFNLDTPNYLDPDVMKFIAFMFEQHPGISITQSGNFEKHKYFMLHGEVKKVQIN